MGNDTLSSLAYLIVTHDGERHIGKLLESIPSGSRVIIVDNASTDATLGVVAEFSGKLDLETVRLPTNRGYAAGINAGMERIRNCADLSAEASAKAEWVFVLNQDIILNAPFEKGGWGDLSLKLQTAYHPYSVVQPRILLPDGTVNVDELRMNVWGFVYPPDYATPPQPKDPTEAFFFSGAAFLLNVGKYWEIGLFNETYFMYYEEIDYAFQAAKKEERILFDPTWSVTHNYTALGSWKKIWWQIRNRSWILQRYASPLHQLLSLSYLPRVKKNRASSYQLSVPSLLLGFHTRQIPQPLRFLVNLVAVPWGWMIRRFF